MNERLLESWLDSAGERTYQGPFCQVLAAAGYTVLHSTRHVPIEFGKDVIARDPGGNLCAYQLKGNPGGRINLRQFREIQPQLWQLATQAIVLPGVSSDRHFSFLVTNGAVDEDVSRAIDDMNRKIGSLGSPISVIARGELVSLFRQHASEFWPTEIPDLHLLFQLLAAKGNEQPPLEQLHKLLLPVLLLEETSERPGQEELRRRITSAAVIVAVSIRSFSSRANHFSVLAAWVLYATYVIAACERHKYDAEAMARPAIEIARDTILRTLLDLADEAGTREDHIEGNPLVDAMVYRARRSLVVGMMSTLWLWCQRYQSWPNVGAKECVESIIAKGRTEMTLWGEAAIPQFLAAHWCWRASDATRHPDDFLYAILRAAVTVRKNGTEERTLAPPYYGFEDVTRHSLAQIMGGPDPFEDDAPRVSSSFAEALFHLLVRTGLKQHCKAIWADLTRVPQETFEPVYPWAYCLWRTDHGQNVTRIIPVEGHWSQVVEHARCTGTPEVPTMLREQPELLLLYTILCPYRATPNAIRHLGRVFNDSWFIPGALPGTPDR